jgi:hypothetical protein
VRHAFTALHIPASAYGFYRAHGWVSEETTRRDLVTVLISHPSRNPTFVCFECGTPIHEVEFSTCGRCRE